MKKIFNIVIALMILISLSSCSSSKQTDFQKFVSCIYSSEEVITGYTEDKFIYDGDMLVYSNEATLTIERLEEQINTSYQQVEKELSSKGEGLVETTSSYTTQGTTKYQTINGKEYQTEYVVPTYFLIFVMSEDFLNEGYTLEVNGKNYNLTASVKNDKISSMFLNKSISTISEITISISIVDSKLQSFEAKYKSNTNLDVTIKTAYSYEAV